MHGTTSSCGTGSLRPGVFSRVSKASSPRTFRPTEPLQSRPARRSIPAQGPRRMRLQPMMVTTSAPRTVAPAAEPPVGWSATLKLHGDISRPDLSIWLVGKDSGEAGPAVNIAKWEDSKWEQPGPAPDGTAFTGEIPAPTSLGAPGAIMIKFDNSTAKRVYATEIKLGNDEETLFFPVHSWIDPSQGDRIFFEGTAVLPQNTPAGLKQLRQAELEAIQGLEAPEAERKGADRIYQYDVYNDLGVSSDPAKKRNTLGGGKKYDGLAYPRRIRTGRQLNPDGTETRDAKNFWVPIDEAFDTSKSRGFVGNLILSALPALRTQALEATSSRAFKFFTAVKLGWLGRILAGTVLWTAGKKVLPAYFSGQKFDNFDDVFHQLYNKDIEDGDDEVVNLLPGIKALDAESRNSLIKPRGSALTTASANSSGWDLTALALVKGGLTQLRAVAGKLLDYSEPLVIKGRHTAWLTDEEYGRQYFAGQNPMVFEAATKGKLAETRFTSIVIGSLEGKSLEELVAAYEAGGEARLQLVDYSILEGYADRINSAPSEHKRHQYAGRLLLYTRNDGAHVPVGIELGTKAEGYKVYTPKDKQVWQLAKAIFSTMDSGIHQLISHWGRTHACMEPFIIATARNLSALHPVHKLIYPHYRYTFEINSKARSGLINAGGIIETLFTPGEFSMEISAVWYGKVWKFKEQGLEADLLARGVAERGLDGELKLRVKDYPYAEDGLLIWNAFSDYFAEYLGIYYPSDADLAADVEIQNWWKEIKEQGHPDALPDGWPEMKTVDDLRFILATIAWTASAHHAAVNFGQYAYSGFPLNKASICRKPIPAQGTPAYAALTNPSTFESEFVDYLSNPFSSSVTMTVVKLLSTHAENEQYLNAEDQGNLYDAKAVEAHEKFVAALNAAEKEMEQRNTDSDSKARTGPGVPYTLLLPDSGPGETVRGVPYSISI